VQLVQQHGGTVTSRLPIINGVGALLPEASQPRLLARPEITAVVGNAPVRTAGASYSSGQQPGVGSPTADYSEVVGANEVWDEDVTGEGVTVAVVDSGLVPTLPGVYQNTSRNARVVASVDYFEPSTITDTGDVPVDPNGHGSHVTGIVASSSTGSDNVWNGIAPDVDLVSVRVLNEEGMGSYESVIWGIQWVVDNKDAFDNPIKVMNLSLVAWPQSPYWADPLNQAAMEAWAAGITVVAAAGNGGPEPMTVGVPGNNPYLITVGAFTDNYTPDDWSDDYITPFSAAGPTLDGFVKPDVIAPGAHMVSTMQSNSHIAMNHEAYREGGTHFSMAGTSQATGVVSGIAALILSEHPELTPDQVKYRIMHTALLWTDPDTEETLYSVWQQGAGRVNAYDAVFGSFATEDKANYGLEIQDDLDDPDGGYEGYSYYDEETGVFRLEDDPGWPASYGTWTGGFSTWAGGFSTWAGGFSTWAGGFSTWAGGFSTWAGGFSTWAGGFSTWAGGFSTWAGGFSTWAGSEPWAGRYDDPAFVASFTAGESPNVEATSSSVGEWVEEFDWQNAPDLFIDDATVWEGDTAVFTVTLSTTVETTATVDYETVSGTAEFSVDFTPISGTLTFAPGETTKTLSVATKNDAVDEDNEKFYLNFGNPVQLSANSDSQAVGTIVDDDGDAAPYLTINNTTVTEGDAGVVTATFTVTLSSSVAGEVTVDYMTGSGTAMAGDDYGAISDTLTFNGTMTQTVSVAVNGDDLDETDETFFVNLSDPEGTGDVFIADGEGRATIIDDDELPTLDIVDSVTVGEGDGGTATATLTVTLSAVSGRSVSIDYVTTAGTATPGSDYEPVTSTLTLVPGQISKTLTVSVTGDTVQEEDETFFVDLIDPVNAILDNSQAMTIIVDDDEVRYSLYLPIAVKP
jgi:serine protease AprX